MPEQLETIRERPTEAEKIARFVVDATFEDIPPGALDRLKANLLDAIGCAICAIDAPPIERLRAQVDRFGGNGLSSLIGGGQSAPDRAAHYNTALTRYLDFMDSFLAKGETCHPSDNVGSVLAAAESANRDGRQFLTALAVAYEVQCRLTEAIPIMNAGFDHTSQLGISIAAGVSKALGLHADRTANAIAIAASDFASLAVIRSSPTSEWKGLASSAVAFAVTNSAFQAGAGATGPLAVFEGPKGFFEAIGERGEADWSEPTLDAVLETALKKYNAEVHTQTALEAVLALRREHGFTASDVERVDAEVFLSAYEIVGGGTYGDRTVADTKEQADHSLPYLVAVALLDGEVWPGQFTPERIRGEDVQALLRRVHVKPHGGLAKPKTVVKRVDSFTRAYPTEMPARMTVHLADGRSVSAERRSYEGFHDDPMPWERVVAKFERLSARRATSAQQRAIVDGVANLRDIDVAELGRRLRLEAVASKSNRPVAA